MRLSLSRVTVAKYSIAIVACLATMAVAAFAYPILDAANTVMLFLLTVFLIARWLGRGPAVMAAFFSVLLFDVIFVAPQFSLAVKDVQYLVTFAVMLTVGLTTAGLTANLRKEAEGARKREAQAQALYELARELAGVVTIAQLTEALERYMGNQGYVAHLHLLDDTGTLSTLSAGNVPLGVATLAMQQKTPMDAEVTDGGKCRIIPLEGATRSRGVMIVSPRASQSIDVNVELIDAIASLVALTVERLHYVEVAQASQLEASAERLRSSVLSALSHDLRTPLTALVGMADGLAVDNAAMPEQARSMAGAIRDQARAMGQLLSNLLDMARLQAGKVQLHREWQLLEDVISSSLNLMRTILAGRPLTVDLAPGMPLVNFDAVLLERVVCNLLENAVKYSPPGTPLEIHAFVEAGRAGISLCDRGQGFPPNDIDRVLGMFERGRAESSTPGVGLGLAICQAIMDAHGGEIKVMNRAGGGACVTILLPLGTPPAIEEETMEDNGDAKP